MPEISSVEELCLDDLLDFALQHFPATVTAAGAVTTTGAVTGTGTVTAAGAISISEEEGNLICCPEMVHDQVAQLLKTYRTIPCHFIPRHAM